MQLNDEDLDKKLEDLAKQRKELYEMAKKTDKTKEKEKYLKIKEDLKQNQNDIVLFTIEKEGRETKIDYDKEIKQLQTNRNELLKLAKNTDKEKEKEKYKQIKKDLAQNKILLEEAQQKKERDKDAMEKAERDKDAMEKAERDKDAMEKAERDKDAIEDYDKEIKQLKVNRNELLKLAKNTDKEKEKEKYKQIKKDLAQNKILLEEAQQQQQQQQQKDQEGEKKKDQTVIQDIDYDKQLQELEKRQEELNETKRKTDKKKDPEKYNRLKEEINKNQKNIVLLTLEKEKQEQEREKTGEEGQKEEGQKEEGQKEANRVLMQLQLGDVILLHDLKNPEFNGSRFFIDYIDDSKMKLINLSSMTTSTLKINKDKTIEDDTIDLISLLFRNKTPSYARQHKLLPGTWLNISFLFENDVPKIETGEITNLEEDMIEIKLFPSNTIIYLNFEYKGMPDNITIEIRDKIVKKITVQQDIELQQDQGIQQEVSKDEVENEEGKMEKEIEVQAQTQPENIMTSLHRIILKANQVEFGKETFGRITQFIDVDISNQRYSLDAQLNDLMDDLFATVPTIERKNSIVLNKIHTTIERFKQLREQFSTFDENGNILYETVKKAKWKPLSIYFEKFDTTLYWILPVVKNIKKIYLTEPTTDESENIDIEIISEEPFQIMTEIAQKYKSAVSSEEDNKYVTMCKEINNEFRPFDYTHHENQKDIIARKKVNTNLLTIVNNNDDYLSYVSRGKGSTSEQGEQNVMSETKYFTQQYNSEHLIGSKLITTKKASMDADMLELKSIMTFPEPIIRFSRINLPGTNLLIKSNLNKSFFKYWEFFAKKIAIQEKTAHEEQPDADAIVKPPISWTKKLGINSNAEKLSIQLLVNNKRYAQAQLDEKTRQLTVGKADLAEAEADIEKANPYTTRFEKKIKREIEIDQNKLTEKAEKLREQIERARSEASTTAQEKIDRLTRELATVKANLLYTKKDLENAEFLIKAQATAQETKVPYSAEIKQRIQRSREMIKNNLKKKVDRLKQKVQIAYTKNVEAEKELAEAQANGDPLQLASAQEQEEPEGTTESEQYEFAKKITNYKMKVNPKLSKEENYKKYIDSVIPNIKLIFQIMKKYMNAKLSIVDVVSYLEPFLIYTDDLTYSQYKDITTYIDEEISKYNKLFTSKKAFFKENINKSDHSNILTSNMMLMSLKIFKTPILKHDIFKKYIENDRTAYFTNQEVLTHFVKSDFGNFYNTFYSKENIELMFPNDVTHLIENINKEFEKEEKTANDKSKCTNYIIAKKYYTMQELEEDNGKNIYFDRQFDETNYGMLDEYEKERSKMKPEDFFVFLQEKLKTKMKIDDAQAYYLTETLINGMRSVLDGHYAILIVITDYSYFIRKNNEWELAKNIDPKLISTNENILCNLQLSCMSKENMCKNTTGSALAIKQEFIKKAIEEFDAKYAMSKDAFQKMLETRLKYYGRIVPKINEIEKERFYKYNNIKYNLGLNVGDDSNIEVSPNSSLLRHILGMNDVEKQQMYIIKFVKMFTEPRMDDPHWLYCKITHMKLIPYFLYTMATHYNSPNYQRHIDFLKKTIGKLSDDGDAWVDKHSGYIIEKINFNIDESYEEGQQRIKTRDSMIGDALLSEALLSDALVEPSSKPKLNKQSQLISNIVTTLSREMGINLESERDFVINTVNTIIQEYLTKKSDYAKKMKEKANKGIIISSYESYYNETVLFATFATFLIAVQTSIPSVQTRKTFPGCVKSFVGYPFDGVSDFSSLTYISCVGYKLRSNVDPWSVLQKKKMEYVYDTTKRMIDTILLELPEIKRKIGEKVEYLLKKPEMVISEEYNLTKWKQFLPPLVEIHIREKDLQYISTDFEKALLKDIKTGAVYKQREKILVLESKVIQYSLAIQEKIQHIVKKQGLLLNSYLENACCMENKTVPMIDFFKQKDGSIETYNNHVINLSKIIKDITDLSTAVMLSSRINTKVIRPPILKIFSEGTIYLAFIYFCKFKIHAPMNEAYLSVCTSKPKIDEKDKDNNAEIIRKMQLSDYNYSSEHLLRLLQLVNQQNMVDINEHTFYYLHTLSGLHVPFSVIEPLDMLHNLMVFINTTEKDDGIQLLIQMLKPQGNKASASDSDSSSENSRSSSETKLGNYLNHHVSSMKTTILDYMKENSKEDLTKKKMKNIERFLDSVMESKSESKMKSSMDLKLKSDRMKMKSKMELDEMDIDLNKESKMEWKYSQLAFFKSYAREISQGFPNIILNKIKYENSQEVQIPSYWKLSRNHVIEIQEFIYNYYFKLAEFIDDSSLKNILIEIKESCDNLLLAINEIYYVSTISERTIELLIQYLFFKIFIKYIELSNKKQEYKKPRNQEEDDLDEDEDYELQERDDLVTISGEQKILKKKVAKLLVTYINIMSDNKKDNDITYDDISDLVFKMKQKEKNNLTQKLKLKSDEERAIDNLFKKYKLGDWNKGLQKGLTEYVAEDYDNAMEERDANQQYENDLRNNPRHGNNYDEGDDLEDNIEQLQIDREIEDDNADMGTLDEDFTDGHDPYFGNGDDDIEERDEY